MLNLLRFYIPNVAKNILKNYLLMLGLSLVLIISPVDSQISEGSITVIFFLIFPLYIYFNPSNYLSASLGWILQTPVPKLSIILANGIINLFKMVMILFLVNITFFIADKATDSPIPLFSIYQWLFTDDKTTNSAYAIHDQFIFLLLFIGLLAILFGILPDLLGNIQDRRNQKHINSLKNLGLGLIVKRVGLIILMFMAMVLVEENLIPQFMVYNLILAIFFFFGIDLTLKSVKFVYNQKKIIYLAIILFASGSFITYKIAHHQITDLNISLDKRFETAHFLGDYENQSYDSLFNEINSGSESTIFISRSDLVNAVITSENQQNVDRAIRSLDILCKERLDHTCRLYAYIVSIRERKSVSVDIIRPACPHDLASCSILSSSFSSTPQDILLAEKVMEDRCKTPTNDFEDKICKNYYITKSRAEKRNQPKT